MEYNKTIIRMLLVVVLATLGCGAAKAQSYTLTNNTTLEIDALNVPSGTLYDDGGADGDYSNGFNGSALISGCTGGTFTLNGSVHTESCCDQLKIYDGMGGTLLQAVSGVGSVSLTVTTGELYVEFSTDGSVTSEGFALSWSLGGLAGLCSTTISQLDTSDVTATGVTLSWTSTGGPLKLDYGCGAQTVSGSGTTLTGLNPNTLYTARLYPADEEGNPCCTRTISFRTLCGVMAAPLVERFDDLQVGAMPPCWEGRANYDTPELQPAVSGNAGLSGTQSLMLSAGETWASGHFSMAMAPAMSVAMNGMTVHLSLRSNQSWARIEVGVCDTVSDMYSYFGFVPVDTLSVPSYGTWYDYTVSLAGYTGDGCRLALRMMQGMQPGTSCIVYVDNVMVENCGVDALWVSHRAPTSLTLHWSDIGEPTVDLTVGGGGIYQTYTDVSSPYQITGLDPDGQYTLVLTPHCGVQYGEPKSVSAATLPGDTLPIAYCQDFEYSMPSEWMLPERYSNLPGREYDNGYCMSMYYGPGQPTMAVMPRIGGSLDGLTLRLQMRPTSVGVGLVVGMMEYPLETGDFEPIDTLRCAGTNREIFDVDLGKYTGSKRYVALRTFSDYYQGDYVYADDIMVAHCMLTGLTATAASSSSVALAWDSTASDLVDSVIVEYGESGFTPGSGNRLALLTAADGLTATGGARMGYTVGNLQAGVAYDFIVYHQCGDQLCRPATASASPLLQDYAVPYCENFDSYTSGAVPTDWHRPSVYNEHPYVSGDGDATTSGGNALRMRSYGPVDEGYQHSTVALPQLAYSGTDDVVVAFHAMSDHSGDPRIEVGFMTDPDDESTFSVVASVLLKEYTWQHYAVDLGTADLDGRYIALRYTHNCRWCGYYAWVDDVEVRTGAPGTASVYSIRTDGAYVDIDTVGTVGSVTLRVTDGTDTTVYASPSFPMELSGLEAGTVYTCLFDYGGCEPVVEFFKTAADAFRSDWCYGFEDYLYHSLPSGWTAPHWYLSGSGDRYSGTRGLYLQMRTGLPTVAVMPWLEEEDYSGLSLTFWAKANYESVGYVGLMQVPHDTSTFTPLDTIEPADNQWRRYRIELGGHEGDGHHLAFMGFSLYGSCGGCDAYVDLDDFRLSHGGFDSVGYTVGAHKVAIGWRTYGAVDSVAVRLEDGQGTAVHDTTLAVTGTVGALTLEELELGTQYGLRLTPVSLASQQRCQGETYTFTTLEREIADGYCEDASGNWSPMPQGWTYLTSPNVGTPTHPGYNSDVNRYSVGLRTGGGNDNYTIAVSPEVTEPLADLVLGVGGWESSYDAEQITWIEAGVIEDPLDASTFTALDTFALNSYLDHWAVDLGAYSGPATHVAIRATSEAGWNRIAYVTDITLSHCLATAVRATDITPTAFTLRWRFAGEGDSVRIVCEGVDTTVAAAPGACRIESDHWTTAQLDAAIVGTCQQQELDCQWQHTTVYLPTEAVGIPACLTLDEGNGGYQTDRVHMPLGWTRPYGNLTPERANYPVVSGGTLHFSARCYGSGSDLMPMAVSPYIDGDLSAAWLDLYVYNLSTHARLLIGSIDDPSDSATFTPHDTIGQCDNGTHLSFSLAAYSGHHLAFRFQADSGYSADAYIDQLALAACPMPVAWLSHAEDTTVRVNWSTSDPVWIEYKMGGDFTPGSGTLRHADSSPLVVDDLVASTAYTFHLWPDCDGTTQRCNHLVLPLVTTQPPLTIPYCNNFEGLPVYSTPDGWTRLPADGYGSTNINETGHDDERRLVLQPTSSEPVMSVLPKMRPTTGCTDSVFVNFWYNWEHSANPDLDSLTVGIIDDINDTATYTPYDTITSSDAAPAAWQHHTTTLPANAVRQGRIAFRIGSGMHWVAIDNLCVEACMAALVEVSQLTQHTATVTWQGHNVDSLVCEYGPEGFAQGTGQTVSIATSPYTIDGLESTTSYNFIFHTVCSCPFTPGTVYPYIIGGGGGTGGWGDGGRNVVIGGTTQSELLIPPYCEDFDTFDVHTLPYGWKRTGANPDTYPAVASQPVVSGTRSLDLFTAVGYSAHAVLPPVEDPASLILSFLAYGSTSEIANASSAAFVVGVMDDPDHGHTFTPVDTILLPAAGRWYSVQVDLSTYSGDGQYIALRLTPTYSSLHVYVDNLYLGPHIVDDASATIDDDGIHLTYTTLGNATGLVVDYSDGTQTTTNTSPALLPLPIDYGNISLTLRTLGSLGDTQLLCHPQPIILDRRLNLPYCENFDATIGRYHDGWKPLRTTNNSWNGYTNGIAEGRLTLVPWNYNDPILYLLPPLPDGDSLGGLILQLDLHTIYDSYSSICLDLGYLTDTNDSETFTTLETLHPETNDIHWRVQLPECSASRLAIRGRSTSYATVVFTIDNLMLLRQPLPSSSDLHQSGTTYAERHLHWDADPLQAYYNYEYGLAGFPQGTGTTALSDSCSITLTGLDAATDYDLYFIDSTGHASCSPVRFFTPSVLDLPYCEDFETYERDDHPSHWYVYGYDHQPRIFTDYTKTLHFSSGTDEMAIMPQIDSSANIRQLVLTADYRLYWWNYTMVVGTVSDPYDPDTFLSIDTVRQDNSTSLNKSNFYRHTTAFASAPADALHVAFLVQSGCCSGVELDNISLDTMPIVTVEPTSATTALLRSDTLHTPDFYVEVCAPGQTPGMGTVYHVQDRTYSLLTPYPLSTYSLYVAASSIVSTCRPPLSLTMPSQLTLPFCEDFDNLDKFGDWTHNAHTVNRTNHEGHSCLYTYNDYYDTSYTCLAMPALPDGDLDNIGLEISYRTTYQGMEVELGFVRSPQAWDSFEPLQTLPDAYNSWQTARVDLAGYEGDYRFLALRYKGTMYHYDYLYIDHVYLRSCPNVRIVQHGYNTIRCTVDSMHTTADYWVRLRTENWDTLMHATTNPFDITGLAPLTDYSVAVQCDSLHNGCGEAMSITTGSLQEVSYCDDFNDYGTGYNAFPNGWRRHVACNSDQLYVTSYNYTQSLCFYSYYYNGCEMMAVLPDMDVDSLRRLSAQCRIHIGSGTDMVQVGVVTDPNDASTFTPVYTAPTGDDQWHTVNFDFSSYNGDGRYVAIRVVGTPYTYNYVYVDYLNLQAMPNVDFTLSAATTLHDTVERPGPVDYWLHCTRDGSNDTVRLHVMEHDYVVPGLDEDENYHILATPDSTGESCWEWTAVATSHEVEMPWCEDFHANTPYPSIPTGWQRFSDTDYPNTSNHYISFYNGGGQYMVTPDVGPVAGLTVQLKMRCGYTSDRLVAGYLSNRLTAESFVPVDTLEVSQSGEWQPKSYRIPESAGEAHFLAFHFEGDWYCYVDDLAVSACDTRAHVSLLHNNVALVDGPSAGGFYVEYGAEGFAQGTGTMVYITSTPTTLTLDYSTAYDFYVKCDSADVCTEPQHVATQPAPQQLPLCIGFEEVANNDIPDGWTTQFAQTDYGRRVGASSYEKHSGSKMMVMENYGGYTNTLCMPGVDADSINGLTLSFWFYSEGSGGNFTVGAMADPADASTFVPVSTVAPSATWRRYIVDFAGVPSGHNFIAFRNSGITGSYYAYLDDLFLSTCGAHGFAATEVESGSVGLTWRQTGSPTIEMEVTGGGSTRHLTPTGPPYTLGGLDALTNYTVAFSAVCDEGDGYCTTNYTDTIRFFTPAGGTGCIDPTNLTADYTTCFTGSYGNPYATVSSVDEGAASIASRHTVHYDTTERDPRTGGQLRTVPEGASASVRLGNWGNNYGSPEAEAVVYALVVDTLAFDLLVMRYAAVLQDPMHDEADQPRFRLELLDSTMALIDPVCGAADFVANQQLGWNREGEDVLWKDWTTVGLDMSAYAGQTVYIRLTTYDCAEGSHYGYAYFTLGCHRKNMVSDTCGAVDYNVFTAPSGFAYSWYSGDDSTDVFSHEQRVQVATSDSALYHCQLAFVDNPQCRFTMSAFAGTRFPLSLFDTSLLIRDCQFELTFRNGSTISADGTTPVGSGEKVETALWDFGNGTTSDQYHGTTIYTEPGTYTVSLVSTIAHGACSDTLSKDITLAFPPVNPRIVGPAERCQGDAPDTLVLLGALTRTGWPSNDTLIVSPLADTTYTVEITDSNGCPHTLLHHMTVHPAYRIETYDTICEGSAYPFGGQTFTADTVVTLDALTATFGCDSIHTLHLAVAAHSDSVVVDTIDEAQLPYLFNGLELWSDTTGCIVVIENAAHCDSTVTLHLAVRWEDKQSRVDTTVCANRFPFQWLGIDVTAPGQYPVLLVGSHGEDSTVTLHVHTHPVYNDTLPATICDNHTYPFGDSVYALQGFYTDSLRSTAGCDSVVTLHLTVHPVTHGDTLATACDSFYWFGNPYEEGTIATSPLLVNQYGCDSTASLHLTILHSTTATLHETMLENDLPHAYLGATFTNDTAGCILHTTNAAGCDSAITYSLTVMWNNSTLVDSTVCASELPMKWNARTFHAAGTQRDTLVASTGADSVVSMTLHVMPVYNDTLPVTICDNQTHSFGDSVYALQGFYTDSLRSTAGCDSVVTLHLTVHPVTHGDTLATACDSFYWFGNRYMEDTIASSPLLVNQYGCDSTASLHLTILHSTTATLHETVLENDLPHTYLGATFTNDTAGCILHTTNAAGCDSAITYSLTVMWNVGTVVDSALCQSALPIEWNGVVFDTTVTSSTLIVRSVTLAATNGADSVVAMRLTVHPLYDHHTMADICHNADYPFGNHLFQGSDGDTIHTDSLRSTAGCDSLSTLHLTVHPVYDHHTHDTLCTNHDYQWGTPMRTIHTAASYDPATTAWAADTVVTDSLSTATYGCDSVSTLHLTLLPAYAAQFDTAICDDGHCMFEGVVYTTDTTVTVGYTTSSGCDSTRSLALTVNPTYDLHLYDTIYEGDRYLFEGTYRESTGEYDKLHATSQGCDSSRTLHLQVLPRTPLDSTLCLNQLPITWNGIVFDADGTHDADGQLHNPGIKEGHTLTLTDSLRLVGRGGLDSLVVMVVTALDTASTTDTLVVCDSLVWQDGHTYRLSTTDPFVTLAGPTGCDSVIHLHLTVNHTAYATDIVERCDSMQWIDGRWYYDDVEGQAGPLGSHKATGPVDTLATTAGCDSVVALRLTVHHSTYEESIDTFCFGQTYQWREHSVSEPPERLYTTVDYYLSDTLRTVHQCDSVLALRLTRMGRPTVRFDYDVDCADGSYSLAATATADRGGALYLRWSAYPPDPRLDGHDEETTVQVAPQSPYTTYYTYTDYHAAPLCPVSDSVRLRHVVVPKAQLKVVPEYLSYENLSYDAYDVTHPSPYSPSPDSASRWSHTWYLDQATLMEQGDHIGGSYPNADLDSVLIWLRVFNGLCADTAAHNLVFLRNALFAPSVFTPLASNNNRFTVVASDLQEAELYIYSRDGLLVFQTTDLDEGWDGRNRQGTMCPQASYVWKLRYSTTHHPDRYKVEVGSVTLLH